MDRNLALRVKSALKGVFLLTAMALWPITESHGAPIAKELKSFCGFKAGEKKKDIKVSKGNDVYPETVRCRTPFRKFRDARLSFSPDDRLSGVSAVTFIKGMKPKAGRAELDACCAELSKYGIVFPDDWREENGGRILNKVGTGPGVSSAHIQGDIEVTRYDEKTEKEIKGVMISIDIGWDLRPPVSPKTMPYNPQSGLSRREFVENVFGVKFGKAIPDTLKESITWPDVVGAAVAQARVSPSFFGMQNIDFECARQTKEIKKLRLSGRYAKTKSVTVQRREYLAFCNEIKNWLKLAPASGKEGDDITFEDDSIQVDVVASVEGGTVCFTMHILPVGGHRSGGIRFVADSAPEMQRRLKETILPSITFHATNTIIDAVSFFQNATADRQKGGFKWTVIGVDAETRIPRLPEIRASDISLWDALKLVCEPCGWVFKAQEEGHLVIVMPKERHTSAPDYLRSPRDGKESSGLAH